MHGTRIYLPTHPHPQTDTHTHAHHTRTQTRCISNGRFCEWWAVFNPWSMRTFWCRMSLLTNFLAQVSQTLSWCTHCAPLCQLCIVYIGHGVFCGSWDAFETFFLVFRGTNGHAYWRSFMKATAVHYGAIQPVSKVGDDGISTEMWVGYGTTAEQDITPFSAIKKLAPNTVYALVALKVLLFVANPVRWIILPPN